MRIITPDQSPVLRQRPELINVTRTWMSIKHYIALGAVLLLAAVLLLFRLGSQGWGNLYYAASVHSMLQSWHNFFFVAFDSAGFLAVDKPPLALWTQAASVILFGWNSASLLLPQALAALLSVAVLFHIVRRSFGATAGVLAALVLALTPISVATGRNNTMDSMLVLVLLLAVWACSIAMRTQRLTPLLLGAALIGIGFNIKMAQALLILPALCVWYIVAVPLPWRRRLINLALAGAVLVGVSLPWVLAVDLTPAAARPFVASSSNSEIDLIVGHNGGTRIVGNPFSSSNELTPYVTDEIGFPGPLRLWQRQLAGQASWLIPLAVLGFIAALCRQPVNPTATESADFDRPALLMWAIWLATCVVFFTVGHKFHRYYLVMLAPPVAALAGVGIVALWRTFWGTGWSRWLLPLAVALTAGSEVIIVSPFPAWSRVLVPLIGGLALMATLALLWLRGRDARMAALAALGSAVAALLIAPALWATTPLQAVDGAQPFAGPDLFTAGTPTELPQLDRLIGYLQSHQHGTRFLAATTRANTAAPLILETKQPVMTFGGYSGGDDILSVQQFTTAINTQEVQYVLLPAQTDQQPAIVAWVTAHCAAVPSDQWREPRDAPDGALQDALGDPYQLFNCASSKGT